MEIVVIQDIPKKSPAGAKLGVPKSSKTRSNMKGHCGKWIRTKDYKLKMKDVGLQSILRHDEQVRLRAKHLQENGFQIVWVDLNRARPDILYYKDGILIAEDVKTRKNGKVWSEVENKWTLK